MTVQLWIDLWPGNSEFSVDHSVQKFLGQPNVLSCAPQALEPGAEVVGICVLPPSPSAAGKVLNLVSTPCTYLHDMTLRYKHNYTLWSVYMCKSFAFAWS
jgi:hypothetical protein